jgi:hypothetical protein
MGTADGYRIAPRLDDRQRTRKLWDEADALDSDVVRYVEAIIRELRACEQVFDVAPSLTTASA